MRLLALVKSPDHVCCRYRLAAYRTHFAQAGHDLHILAWPATWLGLLSIASQLRQADAVIVQRRLLGPIGLGIVRRAARRLIYDFDDAVFHNSSNSTVGPENTAKMAAFVRTVRAADLVIAGNEFLSEQAADVIGHNRVHVIPTCIDFHRYGLARHNSAGVRLVWIGSSSTQKGLERMAGLWNEIGKRCRGVTLRLISGCPMHLAHLPVEFWRWTETSEAGDLASADIGISWVPDGPWSRGKCGLKVLQYMAAGLPALANPVGVHPSMVRHEETGFLVQTDEEWCEAVSRLAADPELRRTMGKAGRATLEREYSVEAGAARWFAALKTLLTASKPTEVAA